MMPEITTKQALLDEMERAHQDLVRWLAARDEADKTAAVLDEGWSVKDSLVHLADWQKITIHTLTRGLQGEQVKRFIPGFEYDTPDQHDAVMQALNDHLYEQSKDRTLDDVMGDFRSTHRAMYDFTAGLSESDIFDPQRFAWREGSPAYEMIAGNTFEHYDEHLGWIKRAIS